MNRDQIESIQRANAAVVQIREERLLLTIDQMRERAEKAEAVIDALRGICDDPMFRVGVPRNVLTNMLREAGYL